MSFKTLPPRPADAIVTVDFAADLALIADPQEGDTRYAKDTDELYTYNGSTWSAGSGAVTNPGTSTDNAAARFDGITGKIIQDSSALIADTGEITSASLTASRALVSGASKEIQSSSTSATELGYVAGVTSAIQTQLNNKQPLDSTLTALAAFNTNGLITQTAADTFIGRTLTGTTDTITVTNGDGVSGNPTATIANTYAGQTSITTLGTVATGTWAGTTISPDHGGTGIANNSAATLTRTGNHALTLTTSNTTSLTLPTTGTLATLAGTEAFTNKTIDADGTGNSITNIENADIKALAAIDATKIANGSVSSTEFQYLDGVTSAIQTQINAKQALDATLTALAAYNTNGFVAQTSADTFAGRLITGTTDRISITNGDGISGNPAITVSATYPGQTSITTLGTVAAGTWNGTVIGADYGGTGVANNSAATLTRSGNHALTLTTSNTTSVTLPTAGTLATLAGTEVLTNKTLTGNKADSFLSNVGAATITLPVTTSTLATISLSESLTNKTLGNTNTVTIKDTLFTLQDDGDVSKQARFQLSGITSGQTRTYTLPDADATVVGLATSQALTNKDFDGGTASNSSRITVPKDTLANITALTRKEGTILYATDTDRFYSDDGVVLTEVGSSSGSGELNEVSNPSASAATTGWTNGTSHTGSRVTSGSPLDPLVTTAFSVVASAAVSESSTSGFYYSIATIATALKTKKLKCEVYVIVPSSDVWRLSIYDGSTRLALSTDSSSVTTLPAGFTGKFTTYFDTTANTAYSVNFSKTTRAGVGNDLVFTNLVVGPGIQPQGAVIGSVTTYTPTISGVGTASAVNIAYVRTGSRVKITGQFTTGTVAASEARLTLPNSYTALSPGGTTAIVGSWQMADTTSGDIKRGVIQAISSNAYVTFSFDEKASVTSPATAQNGSGIWNSSSVVFINFEVEANELQGSGTINVAQNDTEYAYNTGTWDAADTTSFGYGPAGQIMGGSLTSSRAKRVRFQTPILAGDRVTVEVSEDQVIWVEAAGGSVSGAPIILTLDSSGAAALSSGITVKKVSASTTDLDITFNRYQSIANDDAPVVNWPSSAGYWRVRKTAGGQAVGFGEVSQSLSGLVKSAGQLKGTNTNDAAAAGYVGEYLSNPASTNLAGSIAYNITNSTWFSADSGNTSMNDGNEVGIVLTAGDWDVQGTLQLLGAAGTTVSDFQLAIGTAKGTSTTGVDDANRSRLQGTFAATDRLNMSTPVYRITVAAGATTTVYLKSNITFAVSTMQANFYFRARRMR